MFFEKNETATILKTFLDKTEDVSSDNKQFQHQLSTARQVISSMHESPQKWDEQCVFNINNIGDYFLKKLYNFDKTDKEKIEQIYSDSYRFLCEFDFFKGSKNETNILLRNLITNVQNNIGTLDEGALKSDIIYTSYEMPARIVRDLINNENISSFKNFDQKKDEAKKLKQQWDDELQTKQDEVNKLKEKLDEYQTAFNFVGLYQGFSSLEESKKKEVFWLFISLIGMGIIILSPLLYEIYTINNNNEVLELEHLIVLLPIISIEIILIYFFRIILLNHRSVKTQIMQIELRKTLCQFIQSYTEYSSGIKNKDSVALEKFESLIFSGLLSDSGKLPSTFDGIEQISGLIKSIKSK